MTHLKRILLVEDEPNLRTVARLALEAVGGFTVCTCSSGEEALEQAPDFTPDLVLLDVGMPGLDGPATLEALRRLPGLGHTPVIFMSTEAHPHKVATYRGMGALDVIPKPFDPMTLADTVKETWIRHAE